MNKLIRNNLQLMAKIIPTSYICLQKDTLSLTVTREDIVTVLTILKKHSNFQYKTLSCISGSDTISKKDRFKIIYELLSLSYNSRIRIITFTSELEPVSSSVVIFPASGWYESEIWDMFGVFFQNHLNLTRLLTDYGFEGYPLRKDFPLSGFVEASYDFTKRQVLNSKLELSQEYKNLKFDSPWENIKID